MYFSNKETMFIFKLDHPALYVSKVHFININVIYGTNKAYPIRNIQSNVKNLKVISFKES